MVMVEEARLRDTANFGWFSGQCCFSIGGKKRETPNFNRPLLSKTIINRFKSTAVQFLRFKHLDTILKI